MSRWVKIETVTAEREKDKGVVCPETERFTKTEGSLIQSYTDREAA